MSVACTSYCYLKVVPEEPNEQLKDRRIEDCEGKCLESGRASDPLHVPGANWDRIGAGD
jgi:hypothetical protein